MGSLGTSGSDSGFAFQCMTAEDKPILVDGQPVMVVDPADCHQYYLQHLDPTIGWVEQPGGYPAPIVEPPPPVFLEAAKMRFQSDDQDLDDRVIRQLWEDNKELREEVTQLRKNTGDDADEAMAAILRDRINDLLTANADLEREVAKLRYADAARGAAESVETLDKLRQTRDTLNDILTENDQLKIEEDLYTPWPSKRHEELKTEDDQPARDGAKRKTKDDDDDDDDDIKNSSMDNLSKYLAGLVGNFGNKIITKSGNVDWTIAKKFIKGLKTDLGSKFDTAGRLAKEEIDLVVEKFDDLRNFVDSEGVQEHMQATRVAAAKLVKSLVGSVASLKEASEDAAEKTDWASKFEREAAKMKSSLEKRWGEIRGKWEQAVRENEEDEEDDDEGYTSDDNDDDEEDKEKYKKSQKDKYKDDNDDDDKEDEDKKYRKKQKRKEEKDDEDDDDDDGYKSSDDKHKRKKHKKENSREHKKRDDEDYDYRS